MNPTKLKTYGLQLRLVHFTSNRISRDDFMNPSIRQPNYVLGIVAAAVGGLVGFFAFEWIHGQGFYALILPPCFLGLAGGYGIRARSQPFAIICGIAGLVLGLYTEWRFRPFVADASFQYFITHLHNLKPLTIGLLAIGAVISYRLALGLDAAPGSSETAKTN